MSSAPVLPPIEPLTEQDARHKLALGLALPVATLGPTKFGLKVGCDEKTIRNARDEESTLRLDLVWNTLLADEHVLDPLALHFRRLLIQIDIAAANDTETVSRLLHAATEYFDRLRDSVRCHNDTLALADLFRPLLPALAAIVQEADLLRSKGC